MDFVIQNGILTRALGDDPVVTLTEDVREIGAYAFRDCAVKHVILPSSVRHVGSYAFSWCADLEDVRIEGKACLEEGAFYKCAALKTLETPAGLDFVAPSTFLGCVALPKDRFPHMRFSLATLVDGRSAENGGVLTEEDTYRKEYSWDEYQSIASGLLDCTLLYETEECDWLRGQEEPVVTEREIPVANHMIVVSEGRFFGCRVEKETTVYVNNRLERYRSTVLLTPNGSSVLIYAMSGEHCAVDTYARTVAQLKSGGRNAKC